VFAREGLRRGEARRRLRANPKAFRVLTFPHALYYLHRLNVPLDRAWTPEPIEELRGRVDLVVMLAVGKDGKFVEIFGEPWRGFGDVDKTILDHAGLRVHAHRLLAGRLAARDAVAAVRDQVLDQLCSRGLVLDQYDIRTIGGGEDRPHLAVSG